MATAGGQFSFVEVHPVYNVGRGHITFLRGSYLKPFVDLVDGQIEQTDLLTFWL